MTLRTIPLALTLTLALGACSQAVDDSDPAIDTSDDAVHACRGHHTCDAGTSGGGDAGSTGADAGGATSDAGGGTTSDAGGGTTSDASGGTTADAAPPPSDAGGATGAQPVGVSGTWHLVFDDEFDGTTLDTNKWAPSWFNGGKMNNVSTSAANVAVGGGLLALTLASSTSGALVSTNPSDAAKTGFQFTYGFAEARIWFGGSGSTVYDWPAWWTDGQNWPADGEIDIAEGLGTMTSNYHSSSGANNSGTIPGTWAASWHTYAVWRQPGKNVIYFDGQVVRSYATNDGGSPHYLILNIGSSSSPTVLGAQVKVDYVRVWQ